MDDYYYIQKIFSDLYFSKVKPYIEDYNKKRKIERVILAIVLFVIAIFIVLAGALIIALYDVSDKYAKEMIIFGTCFSCFIIFIVLSLVYAFWWESNNIGDLLHLGNPDEKFKEVVFGEATKQLKPYVDISWSKPEFDGSFSGISEEDINYILSSDMNDKLKDNLQNVIVPLVSASHDRQDDFFSTINVHKILRINSKLFKSDDVFTGTFHDVKYEIYEVVNGIGAHLWRRIGMRILIYIGCAIFALLFSAMLHSAITSEIMPYERWHYIIYMIAIPGFFVSTKKMFFAEDGWAAGTYSKTGFLDSFKGVIVKYSLGKEIKGHTIILENHEENLFFKILKDNKFEKVELEDVEFNKRFSVYSTDQIEARYALTSAMMDRLVNLKQTFASQYIRGSFIGNELVLAIQSDMDLFRLGSLAQDTDSKMYQKMFLELISILKITDALNLQNNTGL